MADSEFVEKYYAALGISRDDAKARQRALDRAHDIRKFEIELYWKRATYFWAFQVAACAFVGFLAGAQPSLGHRAFIVPAALGLLTAIAGHLTARGSKFWQDSWEAHVDLLERGA